MKAILFCGLLLVFQTSFGQENSDEKLLKDLLSEFLDKTDSKEMHERFWAEDLIYTSSAGKRFGKSEIMTSFNEEPEEKGKKPQDNSDKPSYSSEDVQIRIYGTTAIIAFKLVGISSDGTFMEYLNSGTFLKRNGQWQAVNWQATKIEQ